MEGKKHDSGKPLYGEIDIPSLTLGGIGPSIFGVTAALRELEWWYSHPGETEERQDVALRTALTRLAHALCADAPYPALELEVSRVLGWGARVYGTKNWRKGMDWDRLYNATLRHLKAYLRGEVLNHEHHEEHGSFTAHHLSHAATNIMFLRTYMREGLGRDSRF